MIPDLYKIKGELKNRVAMDKIGAYDAVYRDKKRLCIIEGSTDFRRVIRVSETMQSSIDWIFTNILEFSRRFLSVLLVKTSARLERPVNITESFLLDSSENFAAEGWQDSLQGNNEKYAQFFRGDSHQKTSLWQNVRQMSNSIVIREERSIGLRLETEMI